MEVLRTFGGGGVKRLDAIDLHAFVSTQPPEGAHVVNAVHGDQINRTRPQPAASLFRAEKAINDRKGQGDKHARSRQLAFKSQQQNDYTTDFTTRWVRCK